MIRIPISRFSPSTPQCRTIVFRHCNACRRNFSSTIVRHDVRYERFSSTSPSLIDWRTWDNSVKLGLGVFAFGTVYYVSHLEQVPETGRWRFMNTSLKFEEKIGEVARLQSREEFKDITLPHNHMISRHVRRVVARILESSNLGVIRGEALPYLNSNLDHESWNPDEKPGEGSGHIREWDVMVVNNSKMINAQVVPGLIIVYTGILPLCKDEQGLASVIAHEIGHVVARHTAERISSQTIVIGFMFLLQTLGLDVGISGIVQKLLFELPNSRTQELEADKIGLALMTRACFDPRAAPDMLSRMAQLEAKIASKIGMDFLQTHPSSASRVQKLEAILPEAYAALAANPDCAAIQDELRTFKDVTLGGHGAVSEFILG